MLVVVIRDGPSSSLKSNFLIHLFRLKPETQFLFISRKEKNRFIENCNNNQIELATSFSGILAYFLFISLIKSPKDLHDGIINRITGKKNNAESRGYLNNTLTCIVSIFC